MIWRWFATALWALMMGVVILMAIASTLFVEATKLMLPAVKWLAEQGDKE